MITIPTSWGQWLAAIVALFVVPAAGSAFWEFLAKPLVVGTTDRMRNATMRLVTLGSRHAEKRFFEAIGHRRLLHPAVAFWRAAWFASAATVGSVLAILLKVQHVQVSTPSTWQIYFVIGGSIFFALLSFYRYIWTYLVDSYIRRFDHAMEIVAPFLSERERLVSRSTFATIDNAGEYRKLVDQLIALTNRRVREEIAARPDGEAVPSDVDRSSSKKRNKAVS
jgi:hypothetical protein